MPLNAIFPTIAFYTMLNFIQFDTLDIYIIINF